MAPETIDRALLTVASPASVGISPLGMLAPLGAHEDGGVLVTCNRSLERSAFTVPLSPGGFWNVSVAEAHRVASAVTVLFEGPGVIALDGDREIKLGLRERARLHVERTGPRVIDVSAVLHSAAEADLF